ncbi:MAG: hypothetical protein M1818_001231 [Claussenomyces sp. TS43310]|nr:MAG: hypothetical protein M1818_001231 [Claussenomyces sp. TS43310]
MPKLPDRPQLCILSEIHAMNKLPLRVILDEAQCIKNTASPTHRGHAAIYRSSVILLSATFLDNKWSDVHGILRLLDGHKFDSKDFVKSFGSKTQKGKNRPPTLLKKKRLVKLIMGCTIVRSDAVLELGQLVFDDVEFEPNELEKTTCDNYRDLYGHQLKVGHRDDPSNVAIDQLIKAMQASTHLRLKDARLILSRVSDKDEIDESKGSGRATKSAEVYPVELAGLETILNNDHDTPQYQKWLQSMRQTDVATSSSRMQVFKATYDDLVTEYPHERMLLNQLGDIVGLMTPATGGTGLNITEASLLIQIKPWWSMNVEKQAYGRLQGQDQVHRVKVRRLLATNSGIDAFMLKNQRGKQRDNMWFVDRLTRNDGAMPEIPKVFRTQQGT